MTSTTTSKQTSTVTASDRPEQDDREQNKKTEPLQPISTILPSPPSFGGRLTTVQIAEAQLQNIADVELPIHFPSACRAVLLEMEGNSRCVDCGSKHPEWAAVSYGALVCLQCAGFHRSLGVNVSTVRSITMDHWKYYQIIQMLEGGNRQLSNFFHRHGLDVNANEFQSSHLNADNIASMRYKTKAAEFYRQKLEHHASHLRRPYKGRHRRITERSDRETS